MLDDADGVGDLKGEFAIWPVGTPTQRTVITRDFASPGVVAGIQVPTGTVTDGGTYAWQVRATDGTDASPWTAPCLFTVDLTAPTVEPTVTSPNYPEGYDAWLPGGVPATFTFGPNGVADAYAYQYNWDFGSFGVFTCSLGQYAVPTCEDWTKIPGVALADKLGGSATVTLSPPRDGPVRLFVRTLDRAGNAGPARQYDFLLRSTAPAVTPSDPQPPAGEPITVTLSPGENVTKVKSYTYSVNNGDERTIIARGDGTAKITVTPTAGEFLTVEARSHSHNGWVSSAGRWQAYIDTAPRVTSTDYPENVTSGGVGVPGTFTFSPRMAGIVEYVYSIDGPEETVPAGADGKARITYAPTQSGWHTVTVAGRTADGQLSDYAYYGFDVVSSAPAVTGSGDARVGTAGEFTITPQTGPAASFVWSAYEVGTGWGAEQTAPVNADGTGTFSFTPTDSSWFTLQAQVVYADGTRSEPGYFSTYAATNAPEVNGVTINSAGTASEFVFGPNGEDVVGYVYQINDEPEQSVAAAADGSATVTWTPADPGTLRLTVRGRHADGSLTLANESWYYVPEAP
jgi:hypothetical protein